jgi:hypothetical protein
VRFPTYSLEERRRLVDVAARLSAYWGVEVGVAAEDHCSMRLFLPGYGPPNAAAAPAVESRVREQY